MGVTAAGAQEGTVKSVQSVATVDLVHYAGRWYEVARFPNRFQTDCARETTADYTVRPDGELDVINTCLRADGGRKQAKGRARLARRDGPASQLKVRFAPGFLSWLSLVWGDYWILDLTDDYGAALVGSPDRQYLWLLARTPALDPESYARLTATAAAQGFDVGRLVRSPEAGAVRRSTGP